MSWTKADRETAWAELEAKLPDVLAGRITDLPALLGPEHFAHAIKFMVLLHQEMLEERWKRMAPDTPAHAP